VGKGIDEVPAVKEVWLRRGLCHIRVSRNGEDVSEGDELAVPCWF